MTRVFWTEDDGAGAGGGAPSPDAPQEQPGEVEKDPAYFSQFRKENRERFGRLKGCRSLDELADMALKGMDAKEPDYTGYIRMPTKDSSKEEIRDFLTKLGVPEGPEKYSIPKEDGQDSTLRGVEDTLRQAAFRAGMTDSQAKAMWGVIHAFTDTAVQRYENLRRERVDGFDSRYESLFLDEYKDPARAKAAVKESQGYFRTFLTETGLGAVLEETGAIYDERIVKALADYQRKNKGSYHSGPQGKGDRKHGTKYQYSEEFYKEFGER